MTAPDVIQQAREALQQPGYAFPGADVWYRALTAVVAAADAGHLIDTRRFEALSGGERIVCLSYEPGEPWPWEADGENAVRRGKTAAEALASAEREAS